MKRFVQSLFAIILVIGFSNVTLAQKTANDNITAEAQVTSNFSINGVEDLDFGSIIAGSNSSVGVNDSGNGMFAISSSNTSGKVELVFTLPPELTNSNGETIDLTFAADDARWENQDGGFSNFDPNSPEEASLGTNGNLDVLIGGTAETTSSTPTGNYTAQITLTANYN